MWERSVRFVVLVSALVAFGGTSAHGAAGRCGLPTAGVQLADGLTRHCGTPPIAAPAGSAPGTGTIFGPPACAGPIACPDWHADQQAPGSPGDGILSAKMLVASADGTMAFAATYEQGGPMVTAHRVADGSTAWSVKLADPAAIPYAITRAAGGELAVAVTVDPGENPRGKVWIVDPSGATRALLSTGPGTEVLDIAAVGSTVVAAGSEGDAALATGVDAAQGKITWQTSWTPTTSDLRGSGWRIAAGGGRAFLGAAGIDDGGMTRQLALVALDGGDGSIQHVSTHNVNGFPPASVVASPDGSLVVLEEANLDSNLNEMLTLAFAVDGRELWSARYRGCDVFKCSMRPWYGSPVAISADGKHVVVTGLGVTVTATTAWGTVAYNATTGAQEWAVRTPINVLDCFCGPSVVASDSRAYVTGSLEYDVATNEALTTGLSLTDGSTAWLSDDRAPQEIAYTNGLVLAGSRVLTIGGAYPAADATKIRTTVAAYAR